MSQQNYTRLQFLMKYLGINKSHIAKDTGLTYAHVRDSTVPQNFSSWLKFALWVFDEMLSRIEGLEKEVEELKEPADFMPPVSWEDSRKSVMGTISIDEGKPEPIEILDAPFPIFKPKDEKK